MPNTTIVPVVHDDMHACGVKTTVGGRTVNGAEEKSFVGEPVAVIVYPPDGTLGTVKLAVRMPPYVG